MVECYYNGKTFHSSYEDYIKPFGGTLFRRLHPRLTLLLTNARGDNLKALMKRVGKSCP